MALAFEPIPLTIALIPYVAPLIASLWMLCDSFRPGRMSLRLWFLFAGLLIALILLPSPYSLIVKSFRVPTGAMEPTLLGARDGNTPDHVVVDRISYRFKKPERGDLIVFRTSPISAIPTHANGGETYYIKRLVGLPGERVEIREGAIYANGRKLGTEDGIPSIAYVSYPLQSFPGTKDGDAYLVGQGEYFVLGDNSANSADSRLWGCVPESALFGKVTKIYYPFSRIGAVTGP